MNNIKSISISAVAITALCVLALMAVVSIPTIASAQSVQASAEPTPTSTVPIHVDAVLNPDTSKILAKRVLVTNLSTGQILFEKDASTIQPIASLAKLMTAITVKEIYATWPNPPQKIKLVSRTAAQTAADRQVAVGGYMKANDLVSYMLLSSSNFAAQSLASSIMPYTSFISYMNFTARKLGITESSFINASGLTEKNGTSPTGNARDIMKTLDIIVKKYPELAIATRSEDAVIRTSSGKSIPIDNTNKSLEKIQNVFLGKTGYTDEAGGNLAIVVRRNGNYYGIVVLNSTVAGRFSDAEYLASLIPLNR
jgi:D-alanyl-D-alanine carboxypeptidase